MKILKFGNEKYEAEKIIKKENSIVGYIGNSIVFEFRGISDWELFSIENGNFDPDPEEEKEAIIAGLTYELVEKDLHIQELETTQAQLIYELMIKGVL